MKSVNNNSKISAVESIIGGSIDLQDEDTNMSESSKTQHILRMVELFRSQYENNSKQLRISLKEEKKLLERCEDLKTDIEIHTTRLRNEAEAQAKDKRQIEQYQKTCEAAQHEVYMSKKREKDAIALIEKLKLEVLDLKAQTLEIRKISHDSVNIKSSHKSHSPLDITFDSWKKSYSVWTTTNSSEPQSSTVSHSVPEPFSTYSHHSSRLKPITLRGSNTSSNFSMSPMQKASKKKAAAYRK